MSKCRRCNNNSKKLRTILASDPEILSGAVRFGGTRVPGRAWLDTILGEESVDYFIDDFPDLTREQALTVLGGDQKPTDEGRAQEYFKTIAVYAS